MKIISGGGGGVSGCIFLLATEVHHLFFFLFSEYWGASYAFVLTPNSFISLFNCWISSKNE